MATVHLHVLHHGMWGNSRHLSEATRYIQERFPKPQDSTQSSDPEIEVLLCQSNAENGTYDGVDWLGERAVDEVRLVSLSLSRNTDVPPRLMRELRGSRAVAAR